MKPSSDTDIINTIFRMAFALLCSVSGPGYPPHCAAPV
jgi:hypothetical protein